MIFIQCFHHETKPLIYNCLLRKTSITASIALALYRALSAIPSDSLPPDVLVGTVLGPFELVFEEPQYQSGSKNMVAPC